MPSITQAKYSFKGSLSGLICADCLESLANVQVRLYRLRLDQNATLLAVSPEKDTLALLSDEQVEAKANMLLVEVITDADGNFTVDLGSQEYQGEVFEVDVYCGTVPHQKPPRVPPKPRQFTITTVQPLWRQRDSQFVAAWDYTIPVRFWCYFRSLMGAWVICGNVVTCADKNLPVSNVKVSAFDVDWLQDDALGSGVTDSAGKFRIDYGPDDFSKTPLSPIINWELTGGPDLYFKVETTGGLVVLNEPSSRGRLADRENVGACFCVQLCVDLAAQPPFDQPLFTNVGDFHIYGSIDPLTGLTNKAVLGHGGPGYGFFGAIKLKGFCPKQMDAKTARYRFLYENLDAPGLLPITGGWVYPVLVGARLILWDTFGTGLTWTFQDIYIQGSGATVDPTPTPVLPPGTPWGSPPAHVIVPDADGWIAVDQAALDDGFYGPLLRFNTTQVLAALVAPGNGAGQPVLDPKNGIRARIVYQAGPMAASPSGPVAFTNELSKILINNWGEVSLLDLQEFSGGGTPCSKITNAINIQYTVDHEFTAQWGIGISTDASPAPVIPPLPSGSAPRGGFGTHFVNVAAWPTCAYVVSLTTRRRLTDGETDDSGRTIQRVFCK
jgi:hypothetical protein